MLSYPSILNIISRLKDPAFWFSIGFSLVLLIPILPIMLNVQTFIHPWRAEVMASVVCGASLIYLLYRNRSKLNEFDISSVEINFIVLPLVTFIIWSGLSVSWASSWKSAVYHTSIWIEYLIFYLITRQLLSNRALKSFIYPIIITLLIIGLPVILEYMSFLVSGGATTLGMRYAKYGEAFNAILPIITILVLRLSGRRFFFGLLMLSAMWLFIISTIGRTNIAIFLFGLFTLTGVIFVFKRFHEFRKKITIVAISVLLAPIPFHLVALLAETPDIPLARRIVDNSGTRYSSNVRLLLKSISLEMFKTHPVIGIGADNFGLQFNEYRIIYAEKNPTDENLQTADSQVAERSHNEYLQILAELGSVGGLIFLWFLGGIFLVAIKAARNFHRTSLISIASLLGIFSFLMSSLISSFSFRLVQNGFIFFFVLAIAGKYIFSVDSTNTLSEKIKVPINCLRLAYISGIIASALLATNCLMRAASVYYTLQAQNETEIENAIPYLERAASLDNENPGPSYTWGTQLFYAGRYSEAVPYLEKTIELGRFSVTDFSNLSTVQMLSGDLPAAENTLSRAMQAFPLTPFVLTRYAFLLKLNGKTEESEFYLAKAQKIDKAQANTWWCLLNEGARQSSFRAAESKDFVQVMDLMPIPAIYAIVNEREIMHPEEKFKIKFSE